MTSNSGGDTDWHVAKATCELVQKDFGIDPLPEEEVDPFKVLFERLETEVQHLLNYDLNKLLNILYRIDVPEDQVKFILELGKPSAISKELTHAIIERQRQKIMTRNKYR